MTWFEKLQSLFILVAVVMGLFLGNIPLISENAASVIAPFLMLMLLGVFLQVPMNHLRKALTDFKFTGLSMAVNFIWTPILAWGLGFLFLRDAPDLWVGLLMLMVTPCTDWYIVFTNIARGNVPLATVQLPWKLLLQLVLLPFYLYFLAGALVEIEVAILIISVIRVLVIPFLLAFVIRLLFSTFRKKSLLEEKVLPKVAIGQFIFLSLAIAAMFASQGSILIQRPSVVLMLLPPIGLFFTINFILGQVIGRILNFSYENVVSFNFTTLARNSPLSLAIAISAFPDRPIIALALVVGPLIELPILAFISQLLLLLRKRGTWDS